MVEWNCRSALKPPGIDSMLLIARSMLRTCSRISAWCSRGQPGGVWQRGGGGGEVRWVRRPTLRRICGNQTTITPSPQQKQHHHTTTAPPEQQQQHQHHRRTGFDMTCDIWRSVSGSLRARAT